MLNVGKFKAVLFDLGGTLLKHMDAPETHKKILEAYGVKIPLDKIAEAHNANQKELDTEEMARLGQYYWVKWNLKMLNRLEVQADREFLARKIDELWWEYTDLAAYPDVEETLTQLSQKEIKLGIISNAVEKDFKQIFQKLDLAGYFDVIVGVDACKKAKPSKEIFHYALGKLQVQPKEAIFVGDSVAYDYEGSRMAGLKPLLIDRDGKKPVGVDAIKSLTELLKYL